ncbi:RNA polymerase subunit sigma-70 [Allokutzneria albata]|nr:RNA polymerase subunit sigma-70 [Allokutzneria albata]
MSRDAHEFHQLTAPYHRELRVHCYRLLGSLTDAEDAVQETLLAAWRGLDDFEGRASLRAWLYRIATNRCLSELRSAKRRLPVAPVPPFEVPEPTSHSDITWLQPYPDDPAAQHESREAVELAFIAALQHLPPRQAAAVVLRDVLDFTLDEVASMLGTGTTAVKGILQRARAALPAPSARPTLDEERDLARRFAEAFSADDVEGVVALLTDDAWLSMPPAPHAYRGREAIAAFLTASATWRAGRHFRLVPTRANGQPAFVCHLDGEMTSAIVLTITAPGIGAITHFLDETLAATLGTP